MLAVLLMAAGALAVTGETKIAAGRMAVLSASGAPDGAAMTWEFPEAMHGEESEGRLYAVAPPGRYRVTVLAVSVKDGKVSIAKARADIEFGGAAPGAPPAIPPAGKAEPAKALMRLRMGSAGCTATVIGPRRPDGRWDLLTAAHCLPRGVTTGQVQTQDGRTIGVTVSVFHAGSDLAWLRTTNAVESLPYAVMASEPAPVGARVWHAGYGIDRPGNREAGKVTGIPGSNGQCQYELNVSSGDSGGGIFREDTGEWVGAVCCTRARGAMAAVWAGSVTAARAIRPVVPLPTIPAADWSDWVPTEIPQCP